MHGLNGYDCDKKNNFGHFRRFATAFPFLLASVVPRRFLVAPHPSYVRFWWWDWYHCETMKSIRPIWPSLIQVVDGKKKNNNDTLRKKTFFLLFPLRWVVVVFSGFWICCCFRSLLTPTWRVTYERRFYLGSANQTVDLYPCKMLQNFNGWIE